MLSSQSLCLVARRQCSSRMAPKTLTSTRAVSSSPYGRTHVWKRRPPVLPNPVVPKFPQLVIRSDGTSFTHWTTSPRSLLRLTRDTTNNPLWNTGVWNDGRNVEDENATTGRLGRFNRKFEESLGGADWIDHVVETSKPTQGSEVKDPVREFTKKGKGKK